jgi:hypothetical protein
MISLLASVLNFFRIIIGTIALAAITAGKPVFDWIDIREQKKRDAVSAALKEKFQI